ncbi:elongation factor [Cyclospora cayetanensis]|uniref:Elongation factor n=1 Tax=Cyclospora cayetanensis TaxID=88456 RepID=A0A1D3D0Q5_9EIME|nr:elongation factor [Cyclospora cayetanensis]
MRVSIFRTVKQPLTRLRPSAPLRGPGGVQGGPFYRALRAPVAASGLLSGGLLQATLAGPVGAPADREAPWTAFVGRYFVSASGSSEGLLSDGAKHRTRNIGISITIQSAASYCTWELQGGPSGCPYTLNLIDTPGHVDFTIEVERALRVLDGAILVVCGVAGIQSQTLTVDRQMKRYGVPRLIFVNKLDRDGADPWRALAGIRKQLGVNAHPVQMPIGLEGKHRGVIDLVALEAVTFKGEKGEEVQRSSEIPEGMLEEAKARRSELVEALAELDEELADAYIQLEDKVSPEQIHSAIRRCTLNHSFVPLLMGSAKGNKGVQPLLDAVCRYLPAPQDRIQVAKDLEKDEEEVALVCDPKKPLVAMAFKIQELPVGQLTYLRLYQGSLRRGDSLLNLSSSKKQQVKRLLLMHADEAREVQRAEAGDIIAVGGLQCHSGVTLTDGRCQLALNSMYIAEPVVSLAVNVQKKEDQPKFAKALNRFQREDPTFKVSTDPESKETLIAGMGELHLQIYLERMQREYRLQVASGQPKVNYRETPTQRAIFDYTHKKQSGGAGQFGRVIGYFEPIKQGDEVDASAPNIFVNELVGNDIPPNFISSIERGFLEEARRGPLTGAPMVNTRFVLQGGKAHDVDSSDIAFRLAAAGALRSFYDEAFPVVLEPLMSVEVSVPREMQAAGLALLNRRQGNVSDCSLEGETVVISAEVPLRFMFGFISDLRAQTQGQGEFSMTFKRYQPMQQGDQDAVVKQLQRERQQKRNN